VTAEEFRAMLSEEPVSYCRDRAFGALLAKESGLGSRRMAIVGRSALEIYTAGDYVSQDIHVVAENPKKVEAALRAWGFRKKGMYWEHPDFSKSVQIVGRFDSGSRQRSVTVSTNYGALRLAAMEDLIWKRTYEARGWNRPEALDEAALLVRRYFDQLDWEYILQRAKENSVEDLASDLKRTRGVLQNLGR
jgi:hypothetical protein